MRKEARICYTMYTNHDFKVKYGGTIDNGHFASGLKHQQELRHPNRAVEYKCTGAGQGANRPGWCQRGGKIHAPANYFRGNVA
ncbi:hypothetical protein D3C71_1790570 [compost metagenome]